MRLPKRHRAEFPRRVLAQWAWGATAVANLFWHSDAKAHCRTMSCEFSEDPSRPSCTRDPLTQCVTQGVASYWQDSCLRYAVQIDGSPRNGIDADAALGLVQAAFAVWKSAPCPGGGNPSFEAIFQGFVGCNRQQSVCGPAVENVNTIIFREEGWPLALRAVAGLTTPRGAMLSGYLIDADVELNATHFSFVADSTDTTRIPIDVQVVLTHELGHFLGIAHSDALFALMSATYQDIPMTRSALLSADDVAAVCEIFPPEQGLPLCQPSKPAYDRCSDREISQENPCTLPIGDEEAEGETSGAGCNQGTPARQTPWSALGLATILASAIGANRRHRWFCTRRATSTPKRLSC